MALANQELQRAIRFGNPLSLLMVDLDHFKRINDSFGHKSGDNVLKKFAEICRMAFREFDVIGRLGGEEFAILLPEASEAQAIEVAERLRARIAAASISTVQNAVIQFTASIGLASLASKHDSLDMLLSHADDALYQAKHAGRNRVSVYGQRVFTKPGHAL